MAAPCAARACACGCGRRSAMVFVVAVNVGRVPRAPASIITKPSVEIVRTRGAARNEAEDGSEGDRLANGFLLTESLRQRAKNISGHFRPKYETLLKTHSFFLQSFVMRPAFSSSDVAMAMRPTHNTARPYCVKATPQSVIHVRARCRHVVAAYYGMREEKRMTMMKVECILRIMRIFLCL